MPHTYDELHRMTAAKLREIAAEIDHDAVHGYRTMHKERLIPAVCEALGIESHEHHEVVGMDKAAVKAQIRAAKARRDEALRSGNAAAYKSALRQIHGLKHRLRRATV